MLSKFLGAVLASNSIFLLVALVIFLEELRTEFSTSLYSSWSEIKPVFLHFLNFLDFLLMSRFVLESSLGRVFGVSLFFHFVADSIDHPITSYKMAIFSSTLSVTLTISQSTACMSFLYFWMSTQAYSRLLHWRRLVGLGRLIVVIRQQ